MDNILRWLQGVMPQPVMQLVPVFAGDGNSSFLFTEGEEGAGGDTKDQEEEPGEAGDGDDQDPSGEGEDTDPEYKELTLDEARRLLKVKDQRLSQVNEESAERRRKLKALEDEKKQKERDAMAEDERIKADLADAQRERDEYAAKVRKLETEKAVSALAVESNGKQFKLIDPSDFKLGTEDDVEDIPQLIEGLFKSKPHYFAEVKPGSPLTPEGSPKEQDKQKGKGNKPIQLPKQKL